MYKKRLDLAFLIDTNGKDAENIFEEGKKVAAKILDSFDISEEKTHVAFVAYSGKPVIKIPFKAIEDRESLKQDIKTLAREDGGVLEEGLKLVAEELFTIKNGARPSARKSLVIITNEKDVPEAEKTKKKLHNKGIKVVVLFLGDNIHQKKAKKLPSTPNLLEIAESLEKKPQIVDDLVEKVTQGTT